MPKEVVTLCVVKIHHALICVAVPENCVKRAYIVIWNHLFHLYCLLLCIGTNPKLLIRLLMLLSCECIRCFLVLCFVVFSCTPTKKTTIASPHIYFYFSLYVLKVVHSLKWRLPAFYLSVISVLMYRIYISIDLNVIDGYLALFILKLW